MQKKKILFLFYRTPLNYFKSNDKRQYLIYSTLKKNYETKILTFGSSSHDNEEVISVKLKSQRVKKILFFLFKLQSPRLTHYYSKLFKQLLNEILNSYKPDLIYVEHLLMMQYVIHLKTNAKIIFFNDESNLYVLENNLRGNFYQRLRNIGLANMEINACKRADVVFTITEDEKIHLEESGFKNIYTLPFGVDVNHFPFEWNKPDEKTILFVGDFSHYPNRQAVFALVKKILPELTELKIKLIIVGRNTNRIKRLINDSVEVYENVSDIRIFYNNASLFVAPIFTGAGLRVKILEAALCGIPLVISPAANLGINLVNKEEAFICNSLLDFTNVLIEIFSFANDERLNSMRIKARKKVADKYDEIIIKDKIQSLFAKIIV